MVRWSVGGAVETFGGLALDQANRLVEGNGEVQPVALPSFRSPADGPPASEHRHAER